MISAEVVCLLTGAVVLAIGTPIAVFHHAIAKELGHLRAHLLAAHAVAAGSKARRRAPAARDR